MRQKDELIHHPSYKHEQCATKIERMTWKVTSGILYVSQRYILDAQIRIFAAPS